MTTTTPPRHILAINDDRDILRVYAVRSFAFRGHCREVPVE